MRHDNKRDLRAKEVRLLEKEYNKLMTAKFNLGYLRLPKPIRHGWVKHLELRDDIARRKDAKVFEEILEATALKIWGRDKKHADKNWSYKHKHDRSILRNGIKRIRKKPFSPLSPKAKKWFERRRYYSQYSDTERYRYCSMVPPYFYKITYTKAYITHRKIIDADIERRLQEIDELLRSDKYYKYSWWGNSGGDSWLKYRQKGLRRREKMNVHAINMQNGHDAFIINHLSQLSP